MVLRFIGGDFGLGDRGFEWLDDGPSSRASVFPRDRALLREDWRLLDMLPSWEGTPDAR
jgi:hypothetical protein